MKNKIIAIGFSIIIIGVSIISLILNDNDVSFFERRKLATIKDVSKDFFENIENYLNDQFPLRNDLLSLNAFYERNILGNKEKNDVYYENGIIYEKTYPLNEKNVESFVNKVNFIKNKYFIKNNTYYMIVPDKAYFLDNNKYLKMDYNKMFNILNNINGNYINIINDLDINDYYKTDIHIKQENWLKLLPLLASNLNFDYYNINYQSNKYEPFYGASYSKVLKMSDSEYLTYLVNDFQNNLSVKHLEYGIKPLYDLEKLKGTDSYDVFLSGPSSLIEINNSNSKTNQELIVFRDSFASSLIPLLTPYYNKITLIDLRYISSDLLDNYLEVNNRQTVLFMYSTEIINNSSILKVNLK